MKTKINPLVRMEGEFEKLARVMSRNYGVKVQIGGNRCCFDGRTIYLPGNSDNLSPEDRRLLHAKLDHERGHATEEIAAQDTKSPSPLGLTRTEPDPATRLMFNAFEDIRIERQMSSSEPGTAENLRHLLRYAVGRHQEEMKNGDPMATNPWLTIASSIILQAQGEELSWVPPEVKAILSTLTEEVSESIRTRNAPETLALARRVVSKVRSTVESWKETKRKEEEQKREEEARKEKEREEAEEEAQEEAGEEEGQEGSEGEEGNEGEDEGQDGDEGSEGSEGSENESEDGDEGSEGEDEGQDGDESKDETEDGNEDEGPEGEGKEGEEGEDEIEDGTPQGGEPSDEETEDEDSETEGTTEGPGEGKEEAQDEGGEENQDGDSGDTEEGQEGGEEESEGSSGESCEGEGDVGESETEGDQEGEGSPSDPGIPDDLGSLEDIDEEPRTDDLTDGVEKELEEKAAEDYRENREHRWNVHPDILAQDDYYQVEVNKMTAPVEYQSLREEISSQVAFMRSKLRNVLKTRSLATRTPDQERGELDESNLYSLKMGNKRVFSTRIPGETVDTAVMVLIDESGSMNHGRMAGTASYYAKLAAIALGETLSAIQVPFEVIGFTNVSYSRRSRKGSVSKEEIVSTSSRFMPFKYDMFKTFDQSFESAKYNLLEITGQEQNVDGEAVMMVAKRLAARKETRKILIVLSDGEPAGGAYGDVNEWYLGEAIRTVTKAGIEVIGVGFGPGANSVRQFYTEENGAQNLPIPPKEIATLGQRLVALMTKMLLNGRK
jgi:cobalamin biosynthesis protein CobT